MSDRLNGSKARSTNPGGNPRAGVSHGDRERGLSRRDRYRELAAGRCAATVIDEVADRLPDADRVDKLRVPAGTSTPTTIPLVLPAP